jgi:hypothetical protein
MSQRLLSSFFKGGAAHEEPRPRSNSAPSLAASSDEMELEVREGDFESNGAIPGMEAYGTMAEDLEPPRGQESAVLVVAPALVDVRLCLCR